MSPRDARCALGGKLREMRDEGSAHATPDFADAHAGYGFVGFVGFVVVVARMSAAKCGEEVRKRRPGFR